MYATDKDIKYVVNHILSEERSRTVDAGVLSCGCCQDLALLDLVLESAHRDVCKTLGRCLLSRKPETTSTPVRRREVAQSLSPVWLCDPRDCSPPGSSVHGILQARILEWVAISFSRGSSPPRDQTWVSCTAGRCFTNWANVSGLACIYSVNIQFRENGWHFTCGILSRKLRNGSCIFVILLSILFCIPEKAWWVLDLMYLHICMYLMYHGEREFWRAAGEKPLIAMKEQCFEWQQTPH